MSAVAGPLAAPAPGAGGGSPDVRAMARTDVVGPLVALMPIAVVLGAITSAAMPALEAWSGGPLLVSGAAQFAIVSLAGAGSGAGAVLATTAVLTSRCAIYGAALAPRFAGQPRWFRVVAAYLLVDQNFSMLDARREITDPRDLRTYYLRVSMPIYAVWLTAMAVGVAVGSAVPAEWRLDLTMVVLVVSMLRPALRTRPAIRAATVAAVTAWLGSGLVGGLGLLLGAFAGMVAGSRSVRPGDPS